MAVATMSHREHAEVTSDKPASFDGPSGADRCGGPLVLVVETHVPLRRLLSSTLLDCGYRVAEAASCGEMERQLLTPRDSASPIRLVVVDGDLPDGSGLATLEAARTRGWQGPAILVVPFARGRDRKEARAVRDCLLLDRPFDGRQLRTWANALVPVRRRLAL